MKVSQDAAGSQLRPNCTNDVHIRIDVIFGRSIAEVESRTDSMAWDN